MILTAAEADTDLPDPTSDEDSSISGVLPTCLACGWVISEGEIEPRECDEMIDHLFHSVRMVPRVAMEHPPGVRLDG